MARRDVIGPRIGPRIGGRKGNAVGPGEDPIGSSQTACVVSTDGPGAVMRPTTVQQWTCVASGVQQPDYLWLLQEASGTLADLSQGSILTPANGSGTFGYQHGIAGWTSKFITTTEATGVRADAAAGSLWNIGTQSILILMYTYLTSAGGTRWILDVGGTSNVEFGFLSTGVGHFQINALTYDGAFVYKNATPTVYPFTIAYDRRSTGSSWWATNKERVVGTWANYSDNTKGIGRSTLAAPPAGHNLLAVWVGSKAETMMDRGGAGLGGKQLITDLLWPMAY
jgi:hypothetical protein